MTSHLQATSEASHLSTLKKCGNNAPADPAYLSRVMKGEPGVTCARFEAGLGCALQASWLAMLGFTCLALLGAISVIISFLAGLYAAGATAIYASVSLAASQQTIAGGSRRRHPALRQHID